MAWDGFFEFNGTEIINVARTEAYLANANLHSFRPLFKNEALPLILGKRGGYTTPLQDDPPWVDPDIPASYDFFGFYPLDVDGIEASTRTAVVTESTLDGGTAGGLRHATRSVVFNGLLLANTEAAADYGMQWLKTVMIGGSCDDQDTAGPCRGSDLRYMSSEPELDIDTGDSITYAIIDGGFFSAGHSVQVDTPVIDAGSPAQDYVLVVDGGSPAVTGGVITAGGGIFPIETGSDNYVPECRTEYDRRLRRFVFTNGPSDPTKRQTRDGLNAWAIQFTGVAGIPFEFGPELGVFHDFMDSENPYYSGVAGFSDSYGVTFVEPPCAAPVWDPIFDPDCAEVIPPPTPPDIGLGCFTAPPAWWRRKITIPKEMIPLTGKVVPVIVIKADDDGVRNMRIRFYPDANGTHVDDATDCDFVGDLVVSYVPPDTALIFDSSAQTVRVLDPATGQLRNADSLVFTTDGKPFAWPLLSCGYGYTVTFDMFNAISSTPAVDLALVSRTS